MAKLYRWQTDKLSTVPSTHSGENNDHIEVIFCGLSKTLALNHRYKNYTSMPESSKISVYMYMYRSIQLHMIKDVTGIDASSVNLQRKWAEVTMDRIGIEATMSAS